MTIEETSASRVNSPTKDAGWPWSWPVDWAPAVRRLAARGRHPDFLLDDPQLVAHRILDCLAALAFEARHGAPDASSAFVKAVRKLVGAAPWVVDNSRQGEVGFTPDPRTARSSSAAHLGASANETGQAFSEDGLIHEEGVLALLAMATRLAGKDAGRAVMRVATAAIAAEQWLPGLSDADDAGYRADIVALGGTFSRDTQPGLAGTRASDITPTTIGSPTWQGLSNLARSSAAISSSARCVVLFHELTESAVPPPEPTGSVYWTDGIDHVEVTEPCGASALLTIHGQGFGDPSPGVGVVAAVWDAAAAAVVYRTVPVMSWSDTKVVIRLGRNAVGGVVAFADLTFINVYNWWADNENERVASAMHAAGCPGYGPPAKPVIWPHWSEVPTYLPAASYQAGMPRIVAEITLDPVGKAPPTWDQNSVHLEVGQTFWVLWRTANSDSAALRAPGSAAQILVAAGYPAMGIPGASGSVKLVAPLQPAVVELTVEASNATCGTTQVPLRLVVTGPALQPVTIEVQQSLPGGDVSVLVTGGVESLNPATGQSVPLVAEKRSVARIDWWTAFPQVPAGEPLTAEATLHVSGPAIPWQGVTLRPGISTANPAPTPSDPQVTLQSGRSFSSVLEYQQWIAASINNNPATFNVVLPAELCVGQITLNATVQARNQDGRLWTKTATRTVVFHQRHRVLIRYRRHTVAGQAAPTTTAAENAIRDAASLLPIPDPSIVVLGNDPATPSTTYVEDMITERNAIANHVWRDEIWLVVGPAGVGGVANPSTWPWTAATDATANVTAHEIGHLFDQRHIALCGAAQNPEQPAAFPDQGALVVTGWDMWNNRLVRGPASGTGAVVDVMTYCWGRMWITPERWRRIFLQAGP
jgi:hypothetical protein